MTAHVPASVSLFTSTAFPNYQEIDELVAEFNPEPLVQKAVPSFYLQRPTLTGYARYGTAAAIGFCDSIFLAAGQRHGPSMTMARRGFSWPRSTSWASSATRTLRCVYTWLACTLHELIRIAGQKRAIEAILHYGVGSCGPRGFYGSIGVCMR